MAIGICELVDTDLTLLDGATAATPLDGDPSTFIDGNRESALWTSHVHTDVSTCDESVYITVDLGRVFSLSSVTIYHFSGDERRYCGQKISTSVTGEFAGEDTVVYDTGAEFGHVETAEGFTVRFQAHSRFVRHWSSRSDANTAVHFIEMEIKGHGSWSATPFELRFPVIGLTRPALTPASGRLRYLP